MFIARNRGRGASLPAGRRDASPLRARPSRSRARLVRPRLVVVAAFGACALLLAGCGGSSAPRVTGPPPSKFDGTPANELTAPNFALDDQHGQLIRLSAERGKFVILTFLYVHCKNVCPIIASQLNEVLRRLPPASRAQLAVLAVSVDPKGDTHAAVAKFIAEHRLLPEFLYLTGTAKTLKPVWKDYHVAAVQKPNSLTIGHTAYELLLNRAGQPEEIYDSTNTPQQVLHDLGLLGLKV